MTGKTIVPARLLELAPGRFAHASGALWLPEKRTALVADVHLGYGWAQRRRRELGPVGDGGVKSKLELLLDELDPAHLVVLGDLVHAPSPAPAERELIEHTVRALAARVHTVLVPGNHDRGFARDFPELPVEVADRWCGPGLLALHGHKTLERPSGEHLIFGHVHPAAVVWDDAGACQKVPVFIAGPHATVLPAFSPLSTGAALSVCLTRELRHVIGAGARAIAATGRRVVRMGAISALG